MKDLEHKEQCALIKWCEIKGAPFNKIFAVPNGGKRNRATAGKLKAEGVRAGIPDLMLPWASRGFNGLFIELKTEKGRVTDKQAERIEQLNNDGYLAVVCHGWEAAKSVMEHYIGEPKEHDGRGARPMSIY